MDVEKEASGEAVQRSYNLRVIFGSGDAWIEVESPGASFRIGDSLRFEFELTKTVTEPGDYHVLGWVSNSVAHAINKLAGTTKENKVRLCVFSGSTTLNFRASGRCTVQCMSPDWSRVLSERANSFGEASYALPLMSHVSPVSSPIQTVFTPILVTTSSDSTEIQILDDSTWLWGLGRRFEIDAYAGGYGLGETFTLNAELTPKTFRLDHPYKFPARQKTVALLLAGRRRDVTLRITKGSAGLIGVASLRPDGQQHDRVDNQQTPAPVERTLNLP